MVVDACDVRAYGSEGGLAVQPFFLPPTKTKALHTFSSAAPLFCSPCSIQYTIMSSQTAPSGGIKGFFQKAAKSFQSGGIFAFDSTKWLAVKGAQIGFIIATTSMVVFMPLLFEISREGQVRDFFCVNVTFSRRARTIYSLSLLSLMHDR